MTTEALPDAAADASADVVAALLDAGADPAAHDDDRGLSALRRAARLQAADGGVLLAAALPDDSTDIDRFIGACLRDDRPYAERQLLAEHPAMRDRLTARRPRANLFLAAGFAPVATIGVMLDLGSYVGLPATVYGEQALAYCGLLRQRPGGPVC